MGWSFTNGATRRDIIDQVVGTEADYRPRSVSLAHCIRGRVLWSVVSQTDEDNSHHRFIACYLLENQTGCGWGYKAMDEAMHPHYYSCPLA